MASITAVMAATKNKKIKQLEEASLAESEEADKAEVERVTWPPLRESMHKFIHNTWFDAGCGVIILFNMGLVVIETDASAINEESPQWVRTMTNCLLGLYTFELTAKLYIYREKFFRDKWNNLDFTIVGVDWVFILIGALVTDMPSVAMLRVFRLVRLGRAVKAASFFHELNALIRSFQCAMKAIFWGILMIILNLIIFSILAVQMINPVNQNVMRNNPDAYEGCDRCARAFATIKDSMLTFFQQLVAGDAWGEVSNPIIEEAPWASLFFLMVLMTVTLTMLNLILAVILEAGAASAAEDEHENAMQMHKTVMKAEKKLIELCESLDVDKSGALNVSEFMNGFSNNMEFKDALEVMHVNEADIQMIFNICDEDGSGDVNYREFVEQLRRIKDSSEKMLLYYVTDIRHMVNRMHNTWLPPTKRENMVPTKHLGSAYQKEKTKPGKTPASQEAAQPEPKAEQKAIPAPAVQVELSPLAPLSEELTETKEYPVDSPDRRIADNSALTLLINDMKQQVLSALEGLSIPAPSKADQVDATASTSSNTQLDQIVRINEDYLKQSALQASAILSQTEVQSAILDRLASEVQQLKLSTKSTASDEVEILRKAAGANSNTAKCCGRV